MNQSQPKALLLTFARRGEEQALQRAIASLRDELPAAEITAVATPVSAPVLRTLGAAHIIIYGEGRGLRQVLREIQACKASAAAIVYANPDFSGHLKLELLAWLSRARRICRFPPDGPPTSAGRFGIASSVCIKTLALTARVLAAAIACGAAFSLLRAAQLLTGGQRASRP